MVDDEYEQLDNVMQYATNTNVPGLKHIDACYIKTPYREESPTPRYVGDRPLYGLVIACDGYSMRKGLLEFWKMVV